VSITDDTDDQLDELEAELGEPARRLPGRRTRITFPDGREVVVRITNRELVLWDKTAPRHKWGAVDSAPFLAQSFTTWAAARRSEVFDGTFDVWNGLELWLEDLPEDSTDEARPTRPGPGVTSS
jgi:hypothetical protein